MGEQIAVAGAKNEAAAELKRAESDANLTVAGGAGAGTCSSIVAAQHVEDVGVQQAHLAIGMPLLVNQQGKRDACVFAKQLGVPLVAETNSRESHAAVLEGRLLLAQLRDVLVAEDSAVMPQEHDDSGSLLPQRAEAHKMPAAFREDDVR
jgi:hypothetical protein